jgi:hypothetical protein
VLAVLSIILHGPVVTGFASLSAPAPEADVAKEAEAEEELEENLEVAEFLDEAKGYEMGSDYKAAIEVYTKAMVAFDAEPGPARQKRDVYFGLADAHEKAYEIDKDRKHLHAARDVFKNYAEAAGPDDSYAAAAESGRDELQARLDEFKRIEDARKRPEPEPEPDKPKRSNKGLGIGLVVGGGALVIVGVSLLGWGAGFRKDAVQSVRDENGDPNLDEKNFSPAEKSHVDAQARAGKIRVGVGAGIAGVGAAAAIVGALLWVKAKKAESEQTAFVVPMTAPRGAGVALVGRF